MGEKEVDKMLGKSLKRRNFWSNAVFIDEVREIKRAKSLSDKRDYSDADITEMIAKDPLFQELKRKLTSQQSFTAQIKIQMDTKRLGRR